ncbi:MAG: ThiF family adenylyltransferase [Polyangia bacterium]
MTSLETSFLEIEGDPISPDALHVPKARELARGLAASRIDFARIVGCRKEADAEWVVFDVDVEIPQIKRHPIRPSERIAARFTEQDAACPTVYALRCDFPQVPHLNLHVKEYPRNLCLYAERYAEVRRSWTASRFVNTIREWMARTSRGELHQDDQPLEPLLGDYVGQLVLPERILDASAAPERLFVMNVARDGTQRLFLIGKTEPTAGQETLAFLASIHRTTPHTHGVIHRCPQTLEDLATLLQSTGLDLLVELRDRLMKWKTADQAVLDARLLIVVLVPMRRTNNSEAERVETWAFCLGDGGTNQGAPTDLRIRDVGQRIGLWDVSSGYIGIHVPLDIAKRGDSIRVDVLNVSFELTRRMAASLNGDDQPGDVRIAAVGAGALGSQVALNLARSGFGRWTLIDHDRLMPHNTARHALPGFGVGSNKAQATAVVANSILGSENLFAALPVDVLVPGNRIDEFSKVLREADCILDVSTSVAVARLLACGVDSRARRISLFMTPSGEDLVLLAEDKERTFRLDSLEMQYYRAVINDPALEGHLGEKGQRRRYGQSCRDITSALPQHMVALHAAIAAGALRRMLQDSHPTLTIWRADALGNVRRIELAARKSILRQVGSWTTVIDEGLLEKLSASRAEKLPNETGGVLLGSFDMERSILYLVDALPSPPDSEEWPTLYIRGSKGLRQAVDLVSEKTHGMLEYAGEWHSHPAGASASASLDDRTVFAWISSLMEADGLPAVMMIVGDHGCTRCFVGEIRGEANVR